MVHLGRRVIRGMLSLLKVTKPLNTSFLSWWDTFLPTWNGAPICYQLKKQDPDVVHQCIRFMGLCRYLGQEMVPTKPGVFEDTSMAPKQLPQIILAAGVCMRLFVDGLHSSVLYSDNEAVDNVLFPGTI